MPKDVQIFEDSLIRQKHRDRKNCMMGNITLRFKIAPLIQNVSIIESL